MNELLDIATRLREVRSVVGISQADLAKALGVSRSSIGKYEAGEHSPDAETLARLCQCLNVDANWLLNGRGSMRSTGQGLLDFATAPGGNTPSSVGQLRQALGEKVFQDLAIGDVALMARLSKAEGPWRVLCVLEAAYPSPRTLEAMEENLARSGFPSTREGIAQDLGFLMRLGHVRESTHQGRVAYMASKPAAYLRSQSSSDVNLHALEAIRWLLKLVLPPPDRAQSEGKLLTLMVTLSKGQSEEFIKTAFEQMKQLSEASCGQKEEETVAIVLGMGLLDEKGLEMGQEAR